MLKRWLCGSEHTLPARLFLFVAGGAWSCACCSFYRGALFGGCLGALAAAAFVLVRF